MASPSVIPGSVPQTTSTEVSVSPTCTPDTIPAESLELFRQECIEVLSALPDRRVQLARFPEAYYKAKGEMFALARYKAKKIVLLAQAIPDTVKVRLEGYEYCETRLNIVMYSHLHSKRWWCNG